MERGRGGASPFLANHGYFVSTLSDDEEDWSEEGREEHRHTETKWAPAGSCTNRWSTDFEHQRHSNQIDSCASDSQHPNNIMYLSQLQLTKSRACSAASQYSLQRSHELLMARSLHEAGGGECPSVQPSEKKSVKGRLLPYVMEPTRELVVTGSPASLGASDALSDDDYPDPIDITDLCYSYQPQEASLHEVEKLKMKVNHNSRVGSGLLICACEHDTTREADMGGGYNSFTAMVQPQRECKQLTMMGPAVYPFRNKPACDQRGDIITSQKQKQREDSRQFRSFRRSQERGQKNHSTSVVSSQAMLGSLDPVKSCGAVREPTHDFLQRFHNSYDDQFSSHESRMQDDTDPERGTMRRTHIRFSHHRRGYSKRQHHEARDGKVGTRCEQVLSSLVTSPRVQKHREDVWTLANAEESYIHDGSLQAPGLTDQWDQRNRAFWDSRSPVESRATSQRENLNRKEQELGLVDSKMVKHPGAPLTKSVKEQLLSAVNLAKGVRQNSTQSKASIASKLDEDGKSSDAESPYSKCLRERQLQTLNVINYKTPETDGRTSHRLMNQTDSGTHRPEVDDRKGMTVNIAPSSGVTAAENSLTDVNSCKRKVGAVSNSLPEKENANQTENTCVSPRLQVSVYSPSQHVEETNVIQVEGKAPEQYTELALQSNRLLKVLGALQVQRSTPGNCYENTSSIVSTKFEGMKDTASQCGYLAQYLKMQNTGARGTRRLLATRR
jgi:hypothetical protein